MRGLFVSLALIGVLLGAANYFGENIAEQRIEHGVRAAFRGQAQPDAEIRGGIFLLQLAGGSFGEIAISIPELKRGGVNISSVEVTLSDVDFALSSVIQGTGDLAIARGGGSGTINEKAIQRALARRHPEVALSIEGDAAILSGGGREARVQEVAIAGNNVTLEAPPLRPLSLELPPPPRGFAYDTAEFERSGLSIGFELADRRLSL